MLIFIFIILCIVLAIYFYISKKEQSYINALSITVLMFLPTNFILPMLSDILGFNEFNFTYGTFYVYFSYLFYLSVFMLTYSLKFKLPIVHFPKRIKYFTGRLKIYTILIFVLSLFAYMPVLLQFSSMLSNPRDIYVATRDGFGHYFFISLLLMNIAFIVGLFSFKNKIILFLFFVPLAYIHGTKGAIITALMMYMMHKIYFDSIKINLINFFKIAFFFSSLMILVFYVTSQGLNSVVQVILNMTGYADETRNGITIIDNYSRYFSSFFYGQLQLENEFFSRIPRVLFPDKPRAFGNLVLPQAVFSEWFDKNRGDASFGIVGSIYADFGPFAIIYLSFSAFLKGLLLRWSVDSFLKTKHVFFFFLILFASGITLIPTGIGYLLPEHIAVALLAIYLFKKIKITNRMKSASCCKDIGRLELMK